eukprot:gnl/MRDRNA2_/MRDRNA2_56476_c0_seq3.p2 gnl/MRDRNA2_/MRDRNA2_56476_c0~~gnl/MRDRNA2_/MRDRNA2_56476_c0_seq3.p2  ORF type:complete len:126 (+),score=6.67 gnl/MRDRNA2_/MRDRNA2_56476_c0_seq3:124-501(+)
MWTLVCGIWPISAKDANSIPSCGDMLFPTHGTIAVIILASIEAATSFACAKGCNCWSSCTSEGFANFPILELLQICIGLELRSLLCHLLNLLELSEGVRETTRASTMSDNALVMQSIKVLARLVC